MSQHNKIVVYDTDKIIGLELGQTFQRLGTKLTVIEGFRIKQLPAFKLPALRELSLRGLHGVESLAGIEGLSGLKGLDLYGMRRIDDISPVARLSGLEWLLGGAGLDVW